MEQQIKNVIGRWRFPKCNHDCNDTFVESDVEEEVEANKETQKEKSIKIRNENILKLKERALQEKSMLPLYETSIEKEPNEHDEAQITNEGQFSDEEEVEQDGNGFNNNNDVRNGNGNDNDDNESTHENDFNNDDRNRINNNYNEGRNGNDNDDNESIHENEFNNDDGNRIDNNDNEGRNENGLNDNDNENALIDDNNREAREGNQNLRRERNVERNLPPERDVRLNERRSRPSLPKRNINLDHTLLSVPDGNEEQYLEHIVNLPNYEPFENITNTGEKVKCIHLGKGYYVTEEAWDLISVQKDSSKFIKNLAEAMWRKYHLANSYVEDNGSLIQIPGRSPRRKLSSPKKKVLIRCFEDRLKEIRVNNVAKFLELRKVGYHLGQHINTLRRTLYPETVKKRRLNEDHQEE